MNGLHTIWCQVSDMDRSVQFYQDLLGLKLAFTSPYWSQFDLGNCQLGLHPQLDGQTPPLGQYGKGWFLGLATEDIRAARKSLDDAGVVIHGDFHDVPGGVVLDFEDLDGNPIELYQEGIKAEQCRV